MEAFEQSQEARLHEAIAHDLNNLLAAIGGYADQVGAMLAPGDPARRDLEQIHVVVRQISILANLIHHGPPTSPTPVELAQIVRMAARLARMTLREVDVRMDDVPTGTIVYADPVHLLRVVLDLVRWMSESSANAGAVAPTVVFSLAERGALRGVRVTSPRTDGSRPSDAVRARARAMGAELVGADGTWELLLSTDPGAEHGRSKSSRLRRVLVAESNALLRSFLVSALDAECVDQASSGAAADLILRTRVDGLDLVVLSLDLDHLDVLARYRELRATNQETWFVFICRDGYPRSELLRLAEADARALVVFKPFSVAHLAQTIDHMTATRIARSRRGEN